MNVFLFTVSGGEGQVMRTWDYDEEGVPCIITTAFVKMWDNWHCVPRSEITDYPMESDEDSMRWALRVVSCWKQKDAEWFYANMQDEIRHLRTGTIDDTRAN